MDNKLGPLMHPRALQMKGFLRLIALDYYEGCIDGRYIKVKNPKYKPDNGEDQYLIYDTKDT